MNPKFFIALLKAISSATDNALAYSHSPYEVVKGATDGRWSSPSSSSTTRLP